MARKEIEELSKSVYEKIDVVYEQESRLDKAQYPGRAHAAEIACLKSHRSDLIEIYEELKKQLKSKEA